MPSTSFGLRMLGARKQTRNWARVLLSWGLWSIVIPLTLVIRIKWRRMIF